MRLARCVAPGLLGLAASLGANTALAAPHTVEELLRPPVVHDIALSPDGKRIAIAYRQEDLGRDVVAVIDADRLDQPDAFRKFSLGETGRANADWVDWATETRLLMGLTISASIETEKRGSRLTKEVGALPTRRVYAIDADGTRPKVLFSGSKRMLGFTRNLSTIVDDTPADPAHVIMAAWTNSSYDLFQVDVFSGEAIRIAKGQSDTYAWDTEGGEPALRYDSNERGTVISVYGRSGGKDDWHLLATYRQQQDRPDWAYAGDAPGAGKIFVRTRPDGSDTENIYIYDIPTKVIGELAARAPGFDMLEALVIDGQYAGAAFISDRLTYVLTDKVLQQHLNAVDKYFGGVANVAVLGVDRAHSRMLLQATGPRAPGDYYLYDLARSNLQLVMTARPWLQPERLASVEIRKTRTRDGTIISSYLTRPAGTQGPLPLIVRPHGGPEVRDSIEFDPTSQALAAQGWLVLQPNFRGSDGYGRAFAEAGYRQWSRRMQDDITDAVNELVEQGIAARGQIAIYGASYGGYAALAGAVVTPDLYRGAVSWAGVSDVREFLDYQRREDGVDSPSYLYWVKIIGDPQTDAVALQAASPRLRAAEIKIPVLLIHGTADGIVPIEQSRIMKAALDKAGKPVRLLEIEAEGHSYWSTENEIRALDTTIAFLKPLLTN